MSSSSERTGLLDAVDGVVVKPVLSKFGYFWIFTALFTNIFLSNLENSIAASIQNSLATSFNAGQSVAWVATSYLIVSTATQPLYGRFSGLLGRTPVYIFALSTFSLGCLLCGLSRSLPQLIAARAVCGIGGGGLVTISQIIAYDFVPMRRRGLYQAMTNTSYGIGGAVGASLGGLLSDTIGWRYAFFLQVPLSLFSLAVYLIKAKPSLAVIVKAEKVDIKFEDVDVVGSILLILWITFTLLILNMGGNEIPWSSPYIALFAGTAIALFVWFIAHEKKAQLPVLPITLFHGREMLAHLGLNFFTAAAQIATFFLLPTFFQATLSTSASLASSRLLAPTLAAPIGSIITGVILNHISFSLTQILAFLGAVIMLFGTGLDLLMMSENAKGRVEVWYWAHVMWTNFGGGVLFPASLINISSKKTENQAITTSLIFLTRSLGSTFGVSASQSVMQNVLARQLNSRITGHGAAKIIASVRSSVDNIKLLQPDIQAKVIFCYLFALRSAFGFAVVCAFIGLLSVCFGFSVGSSEDEQQKIESSQKDVMESLARPANDSKASKGAKHQISWDAIHPTNELRFSHFPSRRSTTFSAKGIVASSQNLASQAGLEILRLGGNAADAAVATAAALNVSEPTNTGVGGDIFCLFYSAKEGRVRAINGSGYAPRALTLEYIRSLGIKGDSIPSTNLNAVTVPGAVAGWIKTIEEFGSGKLTLTQILAPAIRMAEEGIPTSELTSEVWMHNVSLLKQASLNHADMLLGGTHPGPSHLMKFPNLATTLREIATNGHAGFYQGRIAQAIVDEIALGGGKMTLEDLAGMAAEVVEPISHQFRGGGAGKDGVRLWECPPNGQGLTALMALGLIQSLEETGRIPDILGLEQNSVEYLHILIQALRIAFADTRHYVSDPAFGNVPVDELLSKAYLDERSKLFLPRKATIDIKHGCPAQSSDTVYFTTSDSEGNACSFIASNYAGFGSGAIPKGCGFTLQNRGSGFCLRKGHPNCLEGGKRPYHTIIPAMATKGDSNELFLSFGVMGGFMQPQGHVQVLLNILRGFSPQAALDAPRICISAGLPDLSNGGAQADGETYSEVLVEEGIDEEVLLGLKKLGHNVKLISGFERGTIFGRGQLIQQITDPSGSRVWAAGSDPRGDGQAVPQI